MKKFLAAMALALAFMLPASADEFGGGDDVTYCQNVKVVEVEVIKYVEVPEFVEVEVPVYLPSEEESEVVWDAGANRLYAYKIQVWEGPFDTGLSLEKAVWSYDAEKNKWSLVHIE